MSLRCSSKKGIINFKYFDVLELGWCLLPAVEDESAAQVRKGNFDLAFPLILLVSKGWTYCQSVDTLWARRCELHERWRPFPKARRWERGSLVLHTAMSWLRGPFISLSTKRVSLSLPFSPLLYKSSCFPFIRLTNTENAFKTHVCNLIFCS